MSPSLVPLNVCICRGCLAPVCEDPTQKSLSDIFALILKVIRCNTNISLPKPQSLFLANHFIALTTKSLSSVSALSLESPLFNLQLLSSLRMSIGLDLMLLPNKTKSHVNLLSRDLYWWKIDMRENLSKSLTLSCLC